MRARLADFCALTKPDVVAFEAPILGGIQTMNIVRLLIGLAAIVEQFCHERGIEIIEKDVSTVRKHFCGNGRAKKHDVMQRCTMLQWPYSDNNQADAHALWSLVAAEIDPRHAHRSSLIFAGARV
jgi:Holliday junction resolvasome RuvABC endonuclease subunit